MNKIEINYPRKKFLAELENYIQEANQLLKNYNTGIVLSIDLPELERELTFWDEEVQEFLDVRLYSAILTNKYLSDFRSISKTDWAPITKALTGQEFDIQLSNFQHLINCIKKKRDILIILKKKSKFMNITESFHETVFENQEFLMKEIFISHSSHDVKYVEKIIDLLEIIGVPSDNIFCSSFDGYGLKLGNDFLEEIKQRLNSDVLVIFILSANFYSSPISLCEMGATWIKTNIHIPILIPPFDYKDIEGVIPTTNGMKINEKLKFNNLKLVIEDFFELKSINSSIWERKRDNIINEIKLFINDKASK